MQVKLFIKNMWEFFLVFYFVPYKVNIPMHAGEIFYVFFVSYKVNIPMHAGEIFYVFFVSYKVNIPMYAGGFKQVLYNEYICWIQVKIHISDQTSLRICNSARTLTRQRVLPQHFGSRGGGGTHSLAGEGAGGASSDEGTYSPVL
jgi:hypothetical protein